MSPMLLALVSILLSVAAQFALKAGMKAHADAAPWLALLQPMVLLGLGLYGAGAMVWLAVLAKWDVSKAYPLVGIGFALSVAAGHLLGEHVHVTRWVGVAFICLGVYLVSRT
jgi:multidrug transporter EmrE-like cation transporter